MGPSFRMEKALMTQSVIGALRVNLGLDSAQFTKGAKRAESTVARLGSQLQRFGAAMSLVSAGIVAALRSQLNAADDAAKAAQRIGLSVEALTRLRFAADLSGASAQDLETAVARLSRSMQDGNKAFARIGVSATDAAGRLRPTEDVLLDLADAFQSTPDGAAKTAAAMELLGRSGTMLIPLLNGGSDALREMMAEADALGLTITTRTAKAAERFNDSLTRVGGAVTGVGRQIAADLAPVMADIAEAIAGVAARFTQMNPQVRAMATTFTVLTAAVGPAALAIGTLIKGMVALRVASAALFGPVGLLVAGATILGALAISSAAATEKTDTLSVAMRETVEAASVLGTELGILSTNDLPAATRETVGLANANLTLARSAFAAADAQLQLAKARAESLQQQVAVESAFLPGVEPPSQAAYTAALEENRLAAERLRAAQQKLEDAVFSGKKVTEEASEETQKLAAENERLVGSFGQVGSAAGRAKTATEDLTDGIQVAVEEFTPLTSAVDGVANAFGNFIANGLTDFKSFTDSIVGSFRQMLATMIADAVKNKIAISIGTTAAGTASSALAGTASSGLGLAGIATALGPAGIIAGGVAAIGAAIFGRNRARRRREAERQRQKDAIKADQELQILALQDEDAARELAREQSLEGLNRPQTRRQLEIFRLEDEKRVAQEREAIETRLLELQGNTAELRKRELDALDPANRELAERIFRLEDEAERQAELARQEAERQAQLAAIARERESLEERLLRLQGNTEELRRREIAALNETNRPLLQQIFALEDYQTALETSKGALDRLKDSLSGAFDLSELEYGSAFEARLAQVAAARGVDSIAGVAARGLTPAGDPQIELLRKQLTTLENLLQYGIPARA